MARMANRFIVTSVFAFFYRGYFSLEMKEENPTNLIIEIHSIICITKQHMVLKAGAVGELILRGGFCAHPGFTECYMCTGAEISKIHL